MKPNTILGILLILVGLAAFIYQGVSYTTRDKVVDLGPVQVTAEKTHTLPLPPIVGALALLGGMGLLVFSSRRA